MNVLECYYCNKKKKTIYSYLCTDCQQWSYYCTKCNAILEKILHRHFFNCCFCNGIKPITSINVYNNTCHSSPINNNQSNNIFSSNIINIDNIANISKTQVDTKFDVLDNLVNELKIKKSFGSNIARHFPFNYDSSSYPGLLDDLSTNANLNASKAMLANLSINDNSHYSALDLRRLQQSNYDGFGNTHNQIQEPATQLTGINSLINAFSPIKEKEISLQNLFGSASSKSN